MSTALTLRSAQLAQGAHPTLESKATYASVADRQEIDAIHRQQGVQPGTQGVCPHAAAGVQAATLAKESVTARKVVDEQARTKQAKAALSFKTPLTGAPKAGKRGFDYGGFYAEELDKKHRDKSYR